MYFIQITGTHIAKEKGRYRIPDYQRGYEWGTKYDANRNQGNPEVTEFWEDIYERCWRGKENHFLGMVLCKLTVHEGASVFDIVDGQQRITSIFLFCLAVRDFLRDNGLEYHQWTEWLSKHMDQDGELREPRLIPSNRANDREIFLGLFRGGQVMVLAGRSEESKMVTAYRALKGQLTLHFSKNPPEAGEFAEDVLKRIECGFVILGHADNEARIFLTLNDRGKRVDEIVKLRNLIQFSVPDDPVITSQAAETWASLEERLDEREQETFTQAFGERHGFRSVRRRPLDEVELSIREALSTKTFLDWLANLNRCAGIFATLINSPENQRAARGLVRLEAEALYPLILAIIEREGFDFPMLSNLENVVMRTLICHDRPGTRLAKLNSDGCYRMGFQKETWQSDLIHLFHTEHSFSDDDFTENLKKKAIFGPGVARRRALFLLEGIENHLRSQEPNQPVPPIRFGEEYALEQIMPKELTEEWVEELMHGDGTLKQAKVQGVHSAWVGTLGNLTVVPVKYQFPAKESLFREKMPGYLSIEDDHALGLCLNSYFDKQRTWNIKKIEKRGAELAEIAKALWPKP